jgi:L-threonylcarbamoyladenylate synthase
MTTNIKKYSGKVIQQAYEILSNGELLAIPSETVYGLGADATSDSAISKIYKLKKRPHINPLILHVSNIKMVEQFTETNPLFYLLSNYFWPGPLTMILNQKKNNNISELATSNLSSVAVRLPDNKIFQNIIEKFNNPIAAPSANISGHISPTNPYHVYEDFGEEIKLIIDGGQSEKGVESTVIDIRSNDIIILRHGPITQKMLENRVDCKIKKKGSNKKILSPGQMFKHYSPSKKLIINSIKPTKNCSFLGFSNIMPDEKFDGIALNLSNSGDLNEAASNLFKMLRFLDKTDTQEIVVAPIPNKDIGFAINDKLKRASS